MCMYKNRMYVCIRECTNTRLLALSLAFSRDDRLGIFKSNLFVAAARERCRFFLNFAQRANDDSDGYSFSRAEAKLEQTLGNLEEVTGRTRSCAKVFVESCSGTLLQLKVAPRVCIYMRERVRSDKK